MAIWSIHSLTFQLVDAPLDEYGQQFIGDYQGLAADNYFAHPFWNDTRTGSQEIFTAAVPGAQPK